jgi:MinD superfamily P-loop ATPase
MKEIVILSGKGGTGKTSITASFAALAKNKVLADCDVDAPNLHLMLNPTPRESGDFWGMDKAVLNPSTCLNCGACATLCRFSAIRKIPTPGSEQDRQAWLYEVHPLACEGCGFCAQTCPSLSITMQNHLSGRWHLSDSPFGPLAHAQLGVAEANSGKLVTAVKKIAREEAERVHAETIIIDGPPGIGCPVIASLSGASVALIVTEPTPSGKHDMMRALDLARRFGVPTFVCINKFDIDGYQTRDIEQYCYTNGTSVLSNITF